ncbi:Glucose-6-phosphate isomerase [uncultured archaeon]|nr:Glucose-6-phosphate isomerase [uncultured archaeon]
MKIKNGSLPIEWDTEESRLYSEGRALESSVRKLGDMKEVLHDRRLAESGDMTQVLYYMHRDVRRERDAETFRNARRRYDITVIPPATLGDELVKTVGHYHELAPKGVSFTELYEVLSGTAHFMIYRRKRIGGKDLDDRIAEAVLIEAKAGQKVFVPSDFGHVMINPSRDVLVTDNIVEWKFKSLYEPVGRMGGAPYFELVDGTAVKNARFAALPALEKVSASAHAPTLGLKLGRDCIYDLFVRSPQGFGFLEP